jgi:hypothetical protein
MPKGRDQSLAALSLLAANQVKECPNLVKRHEPFEIDVPRGPIGGLRRRVDPEIDYTALSVIVEVEVRGTMSAASSDVLSTRSMINKSDVVICRLTGSLNTLDNVGLVLAVGVVLVVVSVLGGVGGFSCCSDADVVAVAYNNHLCWR